MRPTSITELKDRVARKREAGQPREGDLARLQDARHAQLQAEIEALQRERARDRREPGSFQREVEIDE